MLTKTYYICIIEYQTLNRQSQRIIPTTWTSNILR